MKNDRVGDWLWEEWDGEGLDSSNLFYYTYEWVDISQDLVKRALASCLQRDGVVDSLSEGFLMVESANSSMSYAGFIEGEKSMTMCDKDGFTDFDDFVESVKFITLVEFSS